MRKHLGNILQVDPAERGLEQFDRLDQPVGVLGAQNDGHGVHAAQVLEQERLALHHRQGRLGTDVAQAEDARPV